MQHVEQQQEAATAQVNVGARGPAPYEGFARLPIAGSWRQGRAGKVAPDHDPYTGDTLVEISLADARDVDEAYRCASAVQRRWAAALPQERRDVLERAAHVVEERKEEIVTWLIKESGSTRRKALLEWGLFRETLQESSTYPFHSEGRILPSSIAGKENRVYREPVGVVGVISPWTFPLYLSMRSVGPALAVGDSVVLKPASATPVTGGLLIAKVLEEAGLPPGVLSVIVGAGKDVGDSLVDHAIPRLIAFTGSTEVGRRVGEHAGRLLKRTCLSLSGNGPFIVLEDADLDRAVEAAVAGKFIHQGQSCLAINRFVLDAKIHDSFVERFTERVASLRIGDPSDPNTVIGPLIDRNQLESVLTKVDATIARGARIVLRGQVSGLVLSPIVLADVANDAPTAREEALGPVASITCVDGEDEAIRIANDTECALSSAVFTRAAERGVRVARRIEAAMTQVNDWPVSEDANTAFGGDGGSCFGRWALGGITADRSISVQETPRRYPI